MKRIIAVFVAIAWSISFCFADAETDALWEKYFLLASNSFFYENVASLDYGVDQRASLEEILKAEPDNWLAYYELSSLVYDMGTNYQILMRDTAEYDLKVYESFLQDAIAYEEKANEMIEKVSLQSIHEMQVPDYLKGLNYAAFATFITSSDRDISETAFLKAYECFQGDKYQLVPLFQLMQVYFRDLTCLKVFGTDEKYMALQSNENVRFVCEQICIKGPEVLSEDLGGYLPAQLYQMTAEANAFLAYCAYNDGDSKQLKERIEFSQNLLNDKDKYGNVMALTVVHNIFDEERVVVVELYDAHIRMLHAELTGDLLAHSMAVEDFLSAWNYVVRNPQISMDNDTFGMIRDSID